MTTTKPTIVLVPGAWHSPASFAPTTALLEVSGYTVHAVSLPSVGANPPLENWDADVSAIRTTVESAIGTGNDVVVVMHSYGGLPTQDAVKGLDASSRSASGERGGVIRLVYLAAFFADEGGYLMGFLGDQDLPWFDRKDDRTLSPATPLETFYHDVPYELATKNIASLQPHSYQTFWSKTGYAAWKHIPSTYLVCEDDKAIPAQSQDGLLAGAKENGGKFDTVERVKASHSPFLSVPEWTAGALRRACGEDVPVTAV
ncbi:Prolyl aminopeptidase protein [Neofusicoccum parvum]|nr:Prolyl aminopeptidase protein [Neofusicoccum parvum]